MTEPDQVAYACKLGVDAVGIIFAERSPRRVTIERAKEIRRVVPSSVCLVGVFVDAESTFIQRRIDEVSLDILQMHGDESQSDCNRFHVPYIKALRGRHQDQIEREIQCYPDAEAILLDPYVPGLHGGTGQLLDESIWPKRSSMPMILAGGLTPENVESRVSLLRPFGVDLNSGLESAPGKKDNLAMATAITRIKKLNS